MGLMERLSVMDDDLLVNHAVRVPICLCIDTSFSMNYAGRIAHLNKGVSSFIEETKNNVYAVDAVDLCLISFGVRAEVIQPFANVAKIKFKNLTADGNTPLGEAVELALVQIKKRLKDYDIVGDTHFKPYLIIMSDGVSTDKVDDVARRVRNDVENRKLKVKCIDMSDGKEKNDLEKFSPDQEVSTINSLQIKEFFDNLSRSAAGLSTGVPGED